MNGCIVIDSARYHKASIGEHMLKPETLMLGVDLHFKVRLREVEPVFGISFETLAAQSLD